MQPTSASPERNPEQRTSGADALDADVVRRFHAGDLHDAHDHLGCHLVQRDGVRGARFGVWAPNARSVSVIGSFNEWAPDRHPMQEVAGGVWEAFVPGVERGDRYKFHLRSSIDGYWVDKADPYAVYAERPPRTASIAWDLEFDWGDGEWMGSRPEHAALEAPMSVYEVHLGSWRRNDGSPLSYREIAPKLASYVAEMGFTHVELLPIMEHPFYGSWGYQVTGMFAATSRYGSPQDFMALVDTLHRAGIGVILDWVPSHFPTDEHGPGFFDGSHLYEHADPRQGMHPDWGTCIYNYNAGEVVSYLISSAKFWLRRFHIDGLRVDAVASMLYLDYSRGDGGWIPNRYGGRENLEAIEFLRKLNAAVYEACPDVHMIAEESTSWPQVSRPLYLGGLGFGMKWDMGWMHDTLEVLSMDPVFRRHHHERLTFRQMYAWSENFVLPLSHDEVVHGKKSLLDKMWGDPWKKFAQLRLLYGYMYGLPGKKLLFMGAELAQWREWNHDGPLSWELLDEPSHRGIQRWVADLNRLYHDVASMHEGDFQGDRGFRWVDCHDHDNSVLSWLRLDENEIDPVLVVCNFTPLPRHDYRLGVPRPGRWEEILNSDAETYGGSGEGNLGGVDSEAHPSHGHDQSVRLTVPPFGALFLRPRADGGSERSTEV
jgi:1,4-alpha-glucan branching enzyme